MDMPNANGVTRARGHTLHFTHWPEKARSQALHLTFLM
ncbi:MAG: hypothetical protein ACI9SC_001852 [Gammaproteobacteria bacterium]|jgi:hypothetical protein